MGQRDLSILLFITAYVNGGADFLLSSHLTLFTDRDPGDWTPSLSANVESPGTIRVTVGHSPSQFNLTQFHVMLFKRSHHTDLMYMHQNYTAPVSDSVSVG